MSARKNTGSRLPSAARAPDEGHRRRRRSRPADSNTRRWRRDTRPRLVRATVSATKALRWNGPLIEANTRSRGGESAPPPGTGRGATPADRR